MQINILKTPALRSLSECDGVGVGEAAPKFTVLKTAVSAITLPRAAETIRSWVNDGSRVYVAVTNVHLVMEGYDDPQVQQALNGAAMVTPDGMPLVLLGKLSGFGITRVYGPDLMLEVIGSDTERSLRHYFYGGSPRVNAALAEAVEARFPGTIVAGRSTPPFRALTEPEVRAETDLLNGVAADIVWVALGAPKQELWMARMRSELNAPVLIGVGAAFDFLSGSKPQAPAFMQTLSLEWLFRLACEPRRLWWRYLYHNPRFVMLVLRQHMWGSR